jgi:hypothetical protein
MHRVFLSVSVTQGLKKIYRLGKRSNVFHGELIYYHRRLWYGNNLAGEE